MSRVPQVSTGHFISGGNHGEAKQSQTTDARAMLAEVFLEVDQPLPPPSAPVYFFRSGCEITRGVVSISCKVLALLRRTRGFQSNHYFCAFKQTTLFVSTCLVFLSPWSPWLWYASFMHLSNRTVLFTDFAQKCCSKFEVKHTATRYSYVLCTFRQNKLQF